MKKMFYAVAVVAAMAVCSCGNKAQTTEVVEGEAIEIVTDSCCQADKSDCCKGDSASCCQDSTACCQGDSCTATTKCEKCEGK